MTSGYIALLGCIDPAAVDRVRQAGDYSVVVDAPCLFVACAAADEVMTLRCGRGAIIGTMFDRSGRAPIVDLDAATSEAILDSAGQILIERYWGSYIAFLVDDAGVAIALRDPSGGVACYVGTQAGMSVLTSNVRDAVALGLTTPCVDWDAVAAHLLWPERRVRRTCLVGIDELMPGERLRVAGDGREIALRWTPWQFAIAEHRIDAREDAVELVRRATLNTVDAWCTRYGRPLVSLSGGLDSSILLASTRRPAAAITFMTDEPLGDERRYARAAAEHCSTRLIECPLTFDAIDPRRSAATALPRPVARLFGQELDRRWREAAAQTGADALFHGGGGDNVFCYLAAATPYLDSLLARGPGRDTAATLDSLARMQRVSRWTVRRAAARKLARDRGHYRWVRDKRLLSDFAIGGTADPGNHPWFDARPAWVLPGKEAHVAALIRIQNYLEAIEPERLVPVVAPLMSQPMIETCLRVPTWLWCEDGNNRVIARAAFRDRLPQSVIERRGKGSPAAFDAQIVATMRYDLLELLDGGLLARAGIIDLPAIRQVLGSNGPLRGDLHQRVTELIDVEAWLQSWVDERGRSTAAQS